MNRMERNKYNIEDLIRFPTPFFLIDADELQSLFDSMRSAFSAVWPNLEIGYSFKTNSIPWLLTWFKERGVSAEVVSSDEYNLAEHLGFEKIIFGGPYKGERELIEACEKGYTVNIDSASELARLLSQKPKLKNIWKVGLRVNFDLEKECPGETVMGSEISRFGICYESGELEKSIAQIESSSHVMLVGLHLHNSTKTRSLNIYKAISEKLIEIVDRYKLNLEYIDVGGGFYGGLPDKPSFSDYAACISTVLKKRFNSTATRLIIEPGISLVGSPISYVCKAQSAKTIKNEKVVTFDGSLIDVNPFMRSRNLMIEHLSQNKEQSTTQQVLGGYTCMEDDRFQGMMTNYSIEIGDLIVIDKVGAYSITFGNFFIQYPPQIIAKVANQYLIVREKITAETYTKLSSKL